MLAYLIAFALATTAAAAAPATGPVEETPLMPEVVVLERRGFDPQTGAGTTIDVQAGRGRMLDAGALLGAEPGVTVRRSGGFVQSVGIRGGAANQHQVFINGIPLPSGIATSVSPSIFPLDALERIDVYRGFMPAQFARAPLSGGIDLVTRDPQRAKPGMRLGYGSFGRAETSAFVPVRAGQTSVALGGGLHRWTGDYPYANNNGTYGNLNDDFIAPRNNNDAAAADAFLTYDTRLGGNSLRGHLLATGSNAGLPGFGTDPARQARLDTRLAAAGTELTALHPGGTAAFSVFGGYLRERFHDPRGEFTAPKTNTLNETDQLGIRVTEKFDVALRPRLSIEAESLRFKSETAQAVAPVHRQQRAALAADLEVRWRRLTLFPGGQAEFDALKADDTIVLGRAYGARNTERTLGAARLGASYALTPALLAVASGGTGYRMPNSTEQFGDRGSQVGNPELRPERARFADVGFQWQRETRRAAWTLEIRYFKQYIDDIIGVYQKTVNVASAVNFATAEATGYESTGTLQTKFFRTRANVVYQTVLNTSGIAGLHGKQLPGRPLWEYSSDIALTLRWAEPFYGLQGQGGFFLDPANSPARLIAARHYHNAGVTFLPLRYLRASLNIENLTDIRSVDYIGYPLPGRSYSAVIQLSPP